MSAATVHQTHIENLELIARGKVRDIYAIDEGHMLIVTTDRFSAFDVVFDEPIPHKPDPAPVLLAMERLGVGPAGASYVGDPIWDMRAGRAAGVCTVAALWGPFSEDELAVEAPDVMADRPSDLL